MYEKTVSTRSCDERVISDCRAACQNSPEKLARDAAVEVASRSASQAGRRLSEQIIQVLRATGYLPLRDLDVVAAGGIVILREGFRATI